MIANKIIKELLIRALYPKKNYLNSKAIEYRGIIIILVLVNLFSILIFNRLYE